MQEYQYWISTTHHSNKARRGHFFLPFLGENLLKLNFWYFGFSCIYRTKFDAFSDIDKFSIISKFPFFDIDKLPIISEIPIYRLSIIFHRYIAHPYLGQVMKYIRWNMFKQISVQHVETSSTEGIFWICTWKIPESLVETIMTFVTCYLWILWLNWCDPGVVISYLLEWL